MGPLVIAVIAYAACKLMAIATVPALVLSGVSLCMALIVRDLTRWTVSTFFIVSLIWFASPLVWGHDNVMAWRARARHFVGPEISALLAGPEAVQFRGKPQG